MVYPVDRSRILTEVVKQQSVESEIAAMLEARFGDGLMYLSRNNSRSLYQKALEMGYVDQEGYLTRKGRTLLTYHRFHH